MKRSVCQVLERWTLTTLLSSTPTQFPGLCCGVRSGREGGRTHVQEPARVQILTLPSLALRLWQAVQSQTLCLILLLWKVGQETQPALQIHGGAWKALRTVAGTNKREINIRSFEDNDFLFHLEAFLSAATSDPLHTYFQPLPHLTVPGQLQQVGCQLGFWLSAHPPTSNPSPSSSLISPPLWLTLPSRQIHPSTHYTFPFLHPSIFMCREDEKHIF